MLILNKKNVKDKLIQSGAVVFTPEIRLDSTVLVKDFEIRKFFKEALIELMYNKVMQPDVLIGFDNPGIIFSAMIACAAVTDNIEDIRKKLNYYNQNCRNTISQEAFII